MDGARPKRSFMFSNQVLDQSILGPLSAAVPIWTAWKWFTMWLYCHKRSHMSDSGRGIQSYCVVMMAILPVLRDFHFYLIPPPEIHWKPLYDRVAHIHHTNVDVGPITGPVDAPRRASASIGRAWPFTGSCHASDPCAVSSFNMPALTPAQGHAVWSAFVAPGRRGQNARLLPLPSSQYLSCTTTALYGPLPLDKWFGTFQRRPPDASTRRDERFLAAARKKMTRLRRAS